MTGPASTPASDSSDNGAFVQPMMPEGITEDSLRALFADITEELRNPSFIRHVSWFISWYIFDHATSVRLESLNWRDLAVEGGHRHSIVTDGMNALKRVMDMLLHVHRATPSVVAPYLQRLLKEEAEKQPHLRTQDDSRPTDDVSTGVTATHAAVETVAQM